MKVDEPQESQNKMNPLVESTGERERIDEAGDMTRLTSVLTEQRLKEAVQHRAQDVDDEFLPIPLKRIDSGPHQHHIQNPESITATKFQPTENNKAVHCALLDEIDHSAGPNPELKGRTAKKNNTLTRMLRGIRVEKSGQDEPDDKLGAHMSISKIFQRINPVGKVSRDNFSKVFHRIGDALQKKSDVEEGSSVSSGRTLDDRGCDGEPETAKGGQGEQKCPKIGEKMFRCRPSNTDARKTTG